MGIYNNICHYSLRLWLPDRNKLGPRINFQQNVPSECNWLQLKHERTLNIQISRAGDGEPIKNGMELCQGRKKKKQPFTGTWGKITGSHSIKSSWGNRHVFLLQNMPPLACCYCQVTSAAIHTRSVFWADLNIKATLRHLSGYVLYMLSGCSSLCRDTFCNR